MNALSLASICFPAAIGLVITCCVMGTINMAHGEFIMVGAYTGYVVQQFVHNHTASILIAVPAAGVTPAVRQKTTAILVEAADTRAVVVVAHDMEFARRLERNVKVLHEGGNAGRRLT